MSSGVPADPPGRFAIAERYVPEDEFRIVLEDAELVAATLHLDHHPAELHLRFAVKLSCPFELALLQRLFALGSQGQVITRSGSAF